MAFGFKPVRYRDGTSYTGAAQRCYYGTAADLFVGDKVKLTAASQDVTGITRVELATNAGVFWGIVVGIEVQPGDLTKQYIPSGTTGYVLVCSDDSVVFQVTEDGDSGFIALASVGLNVDAAVGSGDTSYGISGHSLDSSTVNAGAGVQFKLLGLAQIADNVIGSTSTIWEVTLNESTASAPAVGS